MIDNLKNNSVLPTILSIILVLSLWPSAVYAKGSDDEQIYDKESLIDPISSDDLTEVESYGIEEDDEEGFGGEDSSVVVDGSDDRIGGGDLVYEGEPNVLSLTDTVSIGTIEISYDEAQKTISFLGSGKIEPTQIASNAEIQDWLADAEKVIIGAEITELAAYCFRQDQTGIKLPKCTSMEFLGTDITMNNFSLRGLTLLESVKLPSGLTSISSGCFYGCTALSKLIIPTSVTSIGQQTFLNCTSLKTIVNENNESSFPNLMSIGNRAFEGTALSGEIAVALQCVIPNGALPSSVTVKRDYVTSGFDEASGIEWDVSTQGSDRILSLSYTGTGTGVLPMGSYGSATAGVSKWLDATDPDIYSSKGITKVIIGEGIIEVGERCFCNNDGLWPDVVSISIPASVQKIGENAFTSLATLTSFTIAPNSQLKELVASTGGQPRGTWGNCSSLTKLDLSSTQITTWTPEIAGCENLSELVLPSTLTSIEANSFQSVPKLTRFVVPTAVTQMSDSALNYSSISEIVFSSPFVMFSITSGLHMIYCGVSEDQFDQTVLSRAKELWANTNTDYTLTFQPHQCSAGHALSSGQSIDLTCSVCGTSAGVSVEKDGYDYNVNVTAKGLDSSLSSPVSVAFPELVSNFATVGGKFYQGVDLADGLRFSKTTKVETLKGTNGLPVALTVDELTEAPGDLVSHDLYNNVDAIKGALLNELTAAEDATAFHHAHLMAGTEEYSFADLPVSQLTFELPYPVETPELYDFAVAHMVDDAAHPRLDVGDVETLAASKSSTGLRVTVSSLSPFAVSYAQIPSQEQGGAVQGQTPQGMMLGGTPLAQTGDDTTRALQSLGILGVCALVSLVCLEAKRRRSVKLGATGQ